MRSFKSFFSKKENSKSKKKKNDQRISEGRAILGLQRGSVSSLLVPTVARSCLNEDSLESLVEPFLSKTDGFSQKDYFFDLYLC